jgi:hypothetical protein
MKFLILLTLVSIFASQRTDALSRTTMNLLKHREPPVPVAKSTRAITEGWITQKLDHFDTSSTKTFQMVSTFVKCNYLSLLFFAPIIEILCQR